MSGFSFQRRRACRWLLVPAAPILLPALAWASPIRIASARIWPAQEYTRLILEASTPIPHQLIVLKDPPRVVLDLAGVELTPDMLLLPARVQATDPYIAGIRFGRQSTDVLRLVVDLRTEVTPQLFALAPVAEFGHRVVLDLYPVTPIDPLMALLEETRPGDARPPQVSSPPDKPGDALPQVSPPDKPGGALPQVSPPDKPGDARPQVPTLDKPAAAPQDPRSDSRRRITVAIDPGHGGEDPGAIGRRGTHEKDVVLAIAKKLKAMIDAEPGMRAMLTRDADYYLPLAARVQKARRVHADLFISIHADAFSVPTARGSSVFALSEHGATSAAAKWLAQKENSADLIGGVNLDSRDPVVARTLLDLSQTAQISDSLKVGRSVLEGIGAINPLHKAAVEQAGFAVLKAPDIPSILVETAFISNPDEELKLRNDRQQAHFAESIHAGIRRYFATNPPLARA